MGFSDNLKDLTKKIVKRAWIWLGWAIGFILYALWCGDFYWSMALGSWGFVVMVLVDEKVKEGYWFKVEDLRGRGWSHEKIVVWGLINAVVFTILGAVM